MTRTSGRENHSFLWFGFFFAAILISCQRASQAQSAAEILPASTVVFTEIERPYQFVNGAIVHPAIKKLQQTKTYLNALNDQQMKDFLQAVQLIESQIGMPWQHAVEVATSNGIVIAVDSAPLGVTTMIRAGNSEERDHLVATFLRLARQEAKNKGKEDPFREVDYHGVTIYLAEESGFFVFEDWLILFSNLRVAREIGDALCNGQTNSLASTKQFQDAQATKSPEALIWTFLNTEPLQNTDNKKIRKVLSGIPENPSGELILGGVLEAMKQLPYITSTFLADDEKLTFEFEIPFDRSSIPENREHFFGPNGLGAAASIPDIANTLFSVSVYRNVSDMWLRAGDLFDANINNKIAQADSTLTTLFSGKNFAEDILGAMVPQFQLVGVRQDYASEQPVPAIKIPAFALLAEMKDPPTTSREFRRIFQSFIGFLNIAGAMEGKPQLELSQEETDTGQIVSATFIPDVEDETRRTARFYFNFSPTIAFSGNRLILSSTSQLARTLVSTENHVAVETEGAVVNTFAALSFEQLRHVLIDNRTHFITQRMLKEGYTREDAEKTIETILDIMNLFNQGIVELRTTEQHLTLDFTLNISP